MIKEIAFTGYPANDVAGLRAWYEEKLGIAFDPPFVQGGVEKYCQAKIGDGYFSVLAHEWVEREPGSASGIVFEVDDIDKTISALRAKGVDVGDPVATPVCRIAALEDAEGNKVSLHQITVPH